MYSNFLLIFSHFTEDQFALGSITKDLLAVKNRVKASEKATDNADAIYIKNEYFNLTLES